MRVGFIGLGAMGKPIAKHLHKGCESFLAAVRSAEIYNEFREEGITITKSFSDLHDVELLFLCLPDGDVNKDILFGKMELAKRLQSGSIVVDLGTSSQLTTFELAEELDKLSISYLDAPISGLQARAEEGSLTIMCGGEEEVFEKVKPYFEMFGREIHLMGELGAGQLTKLINNIIYNINIAGIAEILPFAVKLGLRPEQIGNVVNSGSGRSFASETFIPAILEGNFNNSYPMASAYKDLVNAAEISSRKNLALPVLAAATNTYRSALLQGHGDCDKGGMIKVFEDLFDVSFRKDDTCM